MRVVSLDFCADILSQAKFEHIVYLILRLPIGTWQPLHEIIDEDQYRYDEDSRIHVSWSKSLKEDDGFCLIIFCEEKGMDMVSGSYNKERLFKIYDT